MGNVSQQTKNLKNYRTSNKTDMGFCGAFTYRLRSKLFYANFKIKIKARVCPKVENNTFLILEFTN